MTSRVFISAIVIILLRCAFSENEVDLILQDIQKEYENFEMSEQKQFVLLLGTTGTGKSTLASLLTGANLTSIKISDGIFSIKDDKDLISGISTTVSKTKVPNLMIDKVTNTTFYDCPGFADSRGVVIDFAATRSIRDLLNFSNKIKILLTISYESVHQTGNRQGFTDLIKHVVNLIGNFEKYENGLALVVTKVPNISEENEEGDFISIKDEAIVNSIGKFIKQAKLDFENARNTTQDRQLNEKQIKFCDILLHRELNTYERINIFRLAMKEGSLTRMRQIQKEKNAINAMIHDTMEYVTTNIADFGYSISDASKGHVANFIIKLEDSLEKYADNICTDLKSFYNNETPLISSGVNSAINLFQLPSNSEFIRRFNQSVVNLGFEINPETLKNISTNIGLLDFLHNIHNIATTSISKQIKNRLTGCASDLLGDIQSQLQSIVPNVIHGIQKTYIDRYESDSQQLNALKNFLTVGLITGMNSTVLRSLLAFTSDQNFSRNMEFFDFFHLLHDNNQIRISGALRACLKDIQHRIYNTFSNDVHDIFEAISSFYAQKESGNYREEIEMPRIRALNINSSENLVNDLSRIVDDLGWQKINSKILRELEFSQMINRNEAYLEKDGNDDHKGELISETIIKDANEYKKYFDDLQSWYNDLHSYLHHLLTYEVQQNITLRTDGMLKLINNVTDNHESRLKSAQAILSQVMSNFSFTMEKNRLIVKGHVVAISDVVKLECWPTAKVIHIFALNKIFFDADIDKIGQKVELSIISPTWEIVPEWPELPSWRNFRQINMQGENGRRKSVKIGKNGKDGSHGEPGGPGGSFFGIGNSFKRGSQLLINAGGGEGGEGQDGERGKKSYTILVAKSFSIILVEFIF